MGRSNALHLPGTPLLADAAGLPPRAGDRRHVDETYVKVNGVCRKVYLAVDQHGHVIDVLVSAQLVLRIEVAASTVSEIVKDAGIDPAPQRTSQTSAAFLRSQAQAIIAADFFEVSTLIGARLYLLAIIEHATRRVRILGAAAHPTPTWVTQAARNLTMDIQDSGCQVNNLVRDRDGEHSALFDAILADTDITTVPNGVQNPRMNSIMERWIPNLRHGPIPHRSSSGGLFVRVEEAAEAALSADVQVCDCGWVRDGLGSGRRGLAFAMPR